MTKGLGFSPGLPPPKRENPDGLSPDAALDLRDEPIMKNATTPTVTAGTPHEISVLMVYT